MTELEKIETRIRGIDMRVSRLEQLSDKYPESAQGFYEQIQKLMDERDDLFEKKMSLE